MGEISAARRLVGHEVAVPLVDGCAVGKAVRIEFDGSSARLGVMIPGRGVYVFAPSELRLIVETSPLP